MKTNKLHALWIAISSALITGFYCLVVITKNLRGKLTRETVDRMIQTWVNLILRRVKTEYTVVNPHHVQPEKGKATIVMCNHSSLYDIPLSFKAFPDHSIRMLAKKELSTMPFMGKAMRAAEFPFIDRKNRVQAIKDLETAKKLMESGIVMWIYPEGTRSNDGKIAPLKKGACIIAIQAKATIIPIGMRGSYDILPARTYDFHTRQKAEIHIGQPIDASAYTLDNKDELLNKVHTVMKELAGQS